MILAIGAKYTSTLSPENSHLITLSEEGEKYEKAKEWNLNVINHLWLEDCFIQRRIVAMTDKKYLYYRRCLAHIREGATDSD